MAEQDIDNWKKMPFDSYIVNIPNTVLDTTLCQEGTIRGEYTWIPSESAKQMVSYRAETFGEKGLHLSKDDIRVIVTDPGEDSTYQIEQLIIAWSEQEQQEATVRRYLQALFNLNESDALKYFCQQLFLNNETNGAITNHPLLSDVGGAILPFKELKSENREQQSESTESTWIQPVEASREETQPMVQSSECMKTIPETTNKSDLDTVKDEFAQFKLYCEQTYATSDELLDLKQRVKYLQNEVAEKAARIEELEALLKVQHKPMNETDQQDYNIMNDKKKESILMSILKDKNDRIKVLEKELEKERMIHYPDSENSKEIHAESEKVSLHEINWDYVTKKDGHPFVVGEGSFGIVYKGLCKTTRKHLAIKVITITNEEVCSIVEREVNILSKLSKHNRILSYIGARYGPDPTSKEAAQLSLQIFTEFMSEGSLRQYVNKMKKEGINRMLMKRYTRQILQGAEYLHSKTESKPVIIHRDIKGNNILCDTHGHVKLADFGCAEEEVSDKVTERATYRKGTSQWMAPEVLRKIRVTTKSDIWSIGCTVVEMLTCEDPYASDKLDKRPREDQVMNGTLNPLKSKIMMTKYKYDKEIQPFLGKCFDMKGENRYSATELLELDLPIITHTSI